MRVRLTPPPEWLDEWLDQERAQPLPTVRVCRWCSSVLGHAEHGLPCREPQCACESSFTCRGDEWRPFVGSDASQKGKAFAMGFDGWIASRLVSTALGCTRMRELLGVTL